MLFVFTFFLFSVSEIQAEAAIIVDNGGTGFSTVGDWPASTMVSGYYGKNYQWIYGGDGSGRATWTFTVPLQGIYQVYAWWPGSYSTRSGNAPFLISHAGGTSRVEANQQINGGKWNKLGTFHFLAGTASVALTGDANGNPVADAVKLESVSLMADFTADSLAILAPSEVQFSDQSYGDISAWQWNFGDGTYSSEQHPVHTYTAPGLYTVSLTVTASDGQTDTKIQTNFITVAESWTSKIIDNGSPGFSKYGDWPTSTTVSGYYGTNYQWDYSGDGSLWAYWTFIVPVEGEYRVSAWWPGNYSTRASNVPYYIKHANGTSLVTANQRSNGGKWNVLGMYHFAVGSAVISINNYANGNPVADAVKMEFIPPLKASFTASPTAGSVPLTVQFSDSSSGGGETWLWDFGDGESDTDQHPVHIYTESGAYSVTLTVTGQGQEDTVFKTDYIQVSSVLKANDDSAETEVNTPVTTGNVMSNDLPGDAPAIITAFDISSVMGGTVTYAGGGVFVFTPPTDFKGLDSFTYTITDSSGRTGTATVSISVNATPNYLKANDDTLATDEDISISIGNLLDNDSLGQVPTGITAIDAFTVAGGRVVNDGNGSFTYIPAADFNGIDSFAYTITDSNGSSSTASVTITVIPVNDLVTANDDAFETTAGNAVLTGNVLINDQLGDLPTGISEFDPTGLYGGTVVSNGNGTFVYTPLPAFTGIDSFTYTITDSNGDIDTATVTVTVNPSPAVLKADFSANPLAGAPPLQVVFSDDSQGDISSWLWEFGDGEYSTEQNPSHIYSATGKYTVKLTVSGNGETDSITRAEYIHVIMLESMIIDNGDSAFSTVGEWPSSTLVPGYYGYSYQYALSGSGSGRAVWSFDVPIEGYYEVFAWWSGPYSTRPSNAPYTITHADGSAVVRVSQNSNVSMWNSLGIYRFAAGTAQVMLSNDADGNPVADAVKMEFVSSVSNFLAAGFSATPLTGVSPLHVVFSDQSQGDISSWLWEFGDGGQSTEQHPSHVYSDPGKYTVTLTVSSNGETESVARAEYISVTMPGAMIIDNGDSAFSTVGDWPFSALVPGYYGDSYQYALSGSGSGRAVWTFDMPAEGYYEVFAWWSGPYSTRPSNAPYVISHADGSAVVRVSQNSNVSMWNSLGIYRFGSGPAEVVLRNDADGNPVADAVKMEPVSLSDVNFSADPLTGYAPLEVKFRDLSGGNISDWLWQFGDGTSSTLQNPVHTYTSPGTYTVTLSVNAEGTGKTISKTDYINVLSSDTVAYDFMWPVRSDEYFIFQAFGNSRLEQSGYHSATDFAVYQTDINVYCIANGWVENFNSPESGFGNGLMIKHLLPEGSYVYSWYNHLANSPARYFTIGQFVPKGTILGIVGETGWAPSGLHLHLEIKKDNDSSGGYISDLSRHYNPFEFIFSRLTYIAYPSEYCSDGTPVGSCSDTKPLHCISGGYLVENSIVCGCDIGVPQTDGTCSKTEDGIIIDNDDPGFQYSGYWETSTYTMGFYGSDFMFAYADNGASTASWTPTITETGYYKIYGWWRDAFTSASSPNASNAVLTVNHAGQQSQVYVDYTDYYKEWKYIGTFLLEAGQSNSVVLKSTPDGDVVADSFRFVWDSP